MVSLHVPMRITLDGCPSGHVGLGTASPTLSWILLEAPAGWKQTAAEVELTRAGATESVRIEGDQQIHIRWPFKPLRSRESVE